MQPSHTCDTHTYLTNHDFALNPTLESITFEAAREPIFPLTCFRNYLRASPTIRSNSCSLKNCTRSPTTRPDICDRSPTTRPRNPIYTHPTQTQRIATSRRAFLLFHHEEVLVFFRTLESILPNSPVEDLPGHPKETLVLSMAPDSILSNSGVGDQPGRKRNASFLDPHLILSDSSGRRRR